MGRGERGQAIVETVIFLPLFIFALLGMMWAIPAAVQYERTASAVRYAGLISQRNNQYTDFSSYAMYGQLGSTALPPVNCTTPSTDALSFSATTYSSSQTVTLSQPFWTPILSSGSCLYNGYWGVQAGGTGLQNDMILRTQEPSVSSSLTIPSGLRAVITGGSTFLTSTSQWFYQPIGIDATLACYPAFGQLINSNLNWSSDASSAVLPVALPNSTPVGTVYNQAYFAINASCV